MKRLAHEELLKVNGGGISRLQIVKDKATIPASTSTPVAKPVPSSGPGSTPATGPAPAKPTVPATSPVPVVAPIAKPVIPGKVTRVPIKGIK